MKQCRVRGKWTINLCNVIHGWSAVSKCLHRQPSKPAVKRILQKKGIYPGQAFLFISRLPDSSRVSSTLYSSALCIFHIDSPFMFYVRQLRGEQLCGRRILCKFRERGRTHFSGRSGAECQTQRAAVPANKQELQTNACLSYYITIIHGDNTSHAAAAVIWKQIDRIYKFSAYPRRDLRDLNLHCQLSEWYHVGDLFTVVAAFSRIIWY